MTSGQDPMDRDRMPADAALAMKTAIRYQRRDKAGRFGRDVQAAQADVQAAEARTTMQGHGGEERFDTAGYEIDPDAVASAIVSRLLAGRTLQPAPRDVA